MLSYPTNDEKREDYSIVTISFCETPNPHCNRLNIYLNESFDDSISLRESATIFAHANDTLTLELYDGSLNPDGSIASAIVPIATLL